MKATTYAYFPPNRNVKMSLCHIWFGVARSKNRGRVRFLRALGGLSIISASWSVRRTVSALACRKNRRFSESDIRFTPYQRWLRFSSTIFSMTGAGRRRPGRGAASPFSPSSPCFRNCLNHRLSELALTPVSLHTNSSGNPSSRCSFTARRRSSNVYRLALEPGFGPRMPFGLTSSFSSMVTLLVSLECHPITVLSYTHDLVVSTDGAPAAQQPA